MAFGDLVVGQAIAGNSNGGDTISLTLPGDPTVGNLLVLTTYNTEGAAAPGTGMSEAVERISVGGSYSTGDAVGIYYRVVQSGDGRTWSVDLTEATQYAAILREIEGPFAASPLDQTGNDESVNEINPDVTAAGATTQADEFVVAAWGMYTRGGDGDTGTISSVNNSFTNLVQEHNSSGFAWHILVGTATKTLTETGTPSVTATLSTDDFDAVMVLATFKKAAGGGASIGGALNVHVRKAL